MTFVITIVAVIQQFAVSLGVGSSTLAIINFFAAIADGTIDETERRMMGIVYRVLRVAMVAILVATVFLIAVEYGTDGLMDLSSFTIAQIIALFVLYLNAMLMTAHVMPSTFGPAIQAGSWYTLGTLMALASLQMTDFTLLHFLMGYVTWIILCTAVVNGIMAALKAKKENRE